MDLSSSSSKSKLVSTFRRRAGSLSRGSLAKNKNKEKDKSHSLTSALRISGPTNYRNNSVTGTRRTHRTRRTHTTHVTAHAAC